MSESTESDVDVVDEVVEPAKRGSLLRDPPPPPGYVDPIERSEVLEKGLSPSERES
jgi:hypothetical protein